MLLLLFRGAATADTSLFGGGYTEEDFRKERKRADDLEASSRRTREQRKDYEKDITADIYAAMFPPVPVSQTTRPLTWQINQDAVARSIALLKAKQMEEDDMISLLLAA
jgi:hypothetical protein